MISGRYRPRPRIFSFNPSAPGVPPGKFVGGIESGGAEHTSLLSSAHCAAERGTLRRSLTIYQNVSFSSPEGGWLRGGLFFFRMVCVRVFGGLIAGVAVIG